MTTSVQVLLPTHDDRSPTGARNLVRKSDEFAAVRGVGLGRLSRDNVVDARRRLERSIELLGGILGRDTVEADNKPHRTSDAWRESACCRTTARSVRLERAQQLARSSATAMPPSERVRVPVRVSPWLTSVIATVRRNSGRSAPADARTCRSAHATGAR